MPFSEEQWQEIVEAHYADIYAFIFRMLGSRADAEDVTQATFLQAFLAIERGDKVDDMRPWLFVIARNKCLDAKRWWKRWLSLLSNAAVSDAPAQPHETFNPGLLALLPARQKEIFILRHWHDFSTTETARLLGISEGAVKSQLKKAVDKLKTAILEEND